MPLDGHSIRPYVQPNAFVAPSASVIGSVTINDCAAVLYGAVVRGDLALIHIGAHSVVGENAVLTAGDVADGEGEGGGWIPADGDDVGMLDAYGGLTPSEAVGGGLSLTPELMVGDRCVVGAGARLDGCVLEGDNVVGDGCVVQRGTRLGPHAQVRGGSVVARGTRVPQGEIWAGVPAAKVGEVADDVQTARSNDAWQRSGVFAAHAYEMLPVGAAYWEKERGPQ